MRVLALALCINNWQADVMVVRVRVIGVCVRVPLEAGTIPPATTWHPGGHSRAWAGHTPGTRSSAGESKSHVLLLLGALATGMLCARVHAATLGMGGSKRAGRHPHDAMGGAP
jgi:hypothetical protein